MGYAMAARPGNLLGKHKAPSMLNVRGYAPAKEVRQSALTAAGLGTSRQEFGSGYLFSIAPPVSPEQTLSDHLIDLVAKHLDRDATGET